MPDADSKQAAEAFARRWRQYGAASASIVWSRLTEPELLLTGGEEGTLATLLQARYLISARKAKKEVRKFLRQFLPQPSGPQKSHPSSLLQACDLLSGDLRTPR